MFSDHTVIHDTWSIISYRIVLVTCNSCVAVALFSGFFTKHWLTKSRKPGDHRSGFRKVGGGLVGIMKMAWKRNQFSTQKAKPTNHHVLAACGN